MTRKAIYTKENIDLLIEKGAVWNFHEQETNEFLHSIHPYPAKFIPQIPRRAIEIWSKPGDIIYDPFCGCGTTPFEAILANREAIGTDNNSVAILISKAKVDIYDNNKLLALKEFYNSFDILMDTQKTDLALIPENKNLPYWFSEDILNRLARLKGLILSQDESLQTILMAVFSSIIVRVSYQDSDTRYSRIKKDVNPKDVDKVYKSRLLDTIKNLPEIIGLAKGKANIIQADSRKVPFIESNSVKLIVTSPPYLNAYDYHKYHRQRIHWIGGDVSFARDIEIGSHDEFTRKNATPDQYFKDMESCFKEWLRILKSDGFCIIVVGDSIVNKQPVSVGDTFVEMMISVGFVLEERSIRLLHSTKRAFNAMSRINQEHVLVFKKN